MTTASHPTAAADAADETFLGRRLRTVTALAVSILMFWYVGYWAVRPSDPLGPVTLMLTPRAWLALAELAALVVAAAGLGVAVNGSGAAGFGSLAAAVGLAAMSLRGGSIESLPLSLPVTHTPWPARALIFELWLWLGLIAMGSVVGAWVDSWARPDADAARDQDTAVDSATEMRRAAGAIVAVSIVAYILILFLGGSSTEPVRKGQVFFSVALAFYVATLLALGVFRVHSPLWLLCSVAVVGLIAYVWNAPQVSEAILHRAAIMRIPVAARALPVEFAAMGTAGVLLGYSSTTRIIQN